MISPGNFPKAKLSENRTTPTEEPLLDYNTFDESVHAHQPFINTQPNPPPPPEQPEAEPNNYRPVFAIIKTFTDYIRIF